MYQSTTYTQINAASVTVDWNNGNMQELSTFVCNGGTNVITFSNLMDRGSYSLLISGGAAHTNFCQFTSSGLTFKTQGGALMPKAGKDVLFTFTRIGTTVIYTMVDNLQ